MFESGAKYHSSKPTPYVRYCLQVDGKFAYPAVILHILQIVTCLVYCVWTYLVLRTDYPPVPNNYEQLKLEDVGSRSVYSGLNPYENTRPDVDLTGKQKIATYIS